LKKKDTAEKSFFQMHCSIHLKTEIKKEEEYTLTYGETVANLSIS